MIGDLGVGLGSLAAKGGRLAKQQLPGELKKVLPTPLQQGLEQLLPDK